MPSGGHFAAMEEPALLAGDLRAFFFVPGASIGRQRRLRSGNLTPASLIG